MMKKISGILVLMMLAVFLQTVFHTGSSLSAFVVREAQAQEWRGEFDDICGKTSSAMNFSREELKTLIERCDKLKVIIEQLEETQKRVYLKRLSLCRDLYAYVLQSKEKE